MSQFLYRIKKILFTGISQCALFVVEGCYDNYWNFCNKFRNGKLKEHLRAGYLERNSAFIGKGAVFASSPTFPHGIHGVHISSGAKIGKNVVIFQNVTIGSNTMRDSKRKGAPTIGDNVFIGTGASVIGKVTIGDNCRIGANCVVVKDMPPNTTAVLGDVRFITKEGPMDNTFDFWEDAGLD